MFEDRLEALAARIGGVRGVSLVAGDGISVASLQSDPELDLEAMAAELLTLVRRISDDDHEPTVGTIRGFSVSGDRMTVAVRGVTNNYFLLAVLDDEVHLGRARYELRRATLAFESDLL